MTDPTLFVIFAAAGIFGVLAAAGVVCDWLDDRDARTLARHESAREALSRFAGPLDDLDDPGEWDG